VSEPAYPVPVPDERRGRDVEYDALRPFDQVAEQDATEEDLPAAAPVDERRRAMEPHRVAIRDAECGEQRRERIADQRGVEVRQIARADDDGNAEQQRDCKPPHRRADDFLRHSTSRSAGAFASQYNTTRRYARFRPPVCTLHALSG